MLDSANAVVTLVAGVLLILGAIGSWVKWGRPRFRSAVRELVKFRDSVNGRDPIIDSITGKQIEPAVPGIGVRMEHQEQQMQLLTDAVAKIANSHERLERLEGRVSVLENAAVERVVNRVESAQAYAAIEAVAKSQPED